MICPRCKKEIPPHIKHEPSIKRDGNEYNGRRKCKWSLIQPRTS